MRKILLVTAVLLLIGAACGDDSPDASSSTTGGEESTTTTVASGEAPVDLGSEVNNHGTKDLTGSEIEVELDDFYFGPTFIKASPSTTITVQLKNEGTSPHTFTIDSLGVDEELQPGDSTDVSVDLPASGATAFYCRFHQSQGMQGAFFFNEGDTVSATSSTDSSDY